MNRYKPVGWRGESHRHYLAAKGIKSTYDYVAKKGYTNKYNSSKRGICEDCNGKGCAGCENKGGWVPMPENDITTKRNSEIIADMYDDPKMNSIYNSEMFDAVLGSDKLTPLAWESGVRIAAIDDEGNLVLYTEGDYDIIKNASQEQIEKVIQMYDMREVTPAGERRDSRFNRDNFNASKPKFLFREENLGEAEFKKAPFYVELYDQWHAKTGQEPFVDTSSPITVAEFQMIRDKMIDEGLEISRVKQ